MEVELNDSCTDEKLEDPTCWDYRRKSKFHEGSSIGSEDDTHPVEGVTALWAKDAIDGYLAADEIDEEGDGGVEDLFAIVDIASGAVDEGKYFDGGLEHVEDPKAHWFYQTNNYTSSHRHNHST